MNIRQWITLCESEDQILPITVADERATDIYTDLDTCERVIWEKTNIIDTYELNEVGLGEDVTGAPVLLKVCTDGGIVGCYG